MKNAHRASRQRKREATDFALLFSSSPFCPFPNAPLSRPPPILQTTFVPMNGKRVLWYMCGPTVYDAAHMGHAR